MELVINAEGRITIPAAARKALNIKSNDVLIAELKDKTLVVSKKYEACPLCGSTVELMDVDGIKICKPCIQKIKSHIG